MTDTSFPGRIAARLTSRRGARLSLAAAALILVALLGLFGGATAPSGASGAPADAESTRAAELLTGFPDGDRQAVLILAVRPDRTELTEADLTAVGELVPAVETNTGATVGGPVVSEDGAAALLTVPITVGADNSATADTVGELRALLADRGPETLRLSVTGGPAFGADVASAFDGADLTLLLVTVLIVALLLIATYRSPVLWLVPLTVVGLADQLAGRVTAALGSALDLRFDTGVISVLVFGAGANYALLLISRYREELSAETDHRTALAAAWRHTVPAILASNLTVVLALLTLALAVVPGTRGLGVAAAVGLLVAAAAVLFALPPLLALCGRRVFWPLIPRPGDGKPGGRVWRAVATRVVRRPWWGLAAGGALLAVLVTGLAGTSVGLSQLEKFRVPSESATGLVTLSKHFPAGESQPVLVVTDRAAAERTATAIDGIDGVERATVIAESTDGALAEIMVIGRPAPGTDAGLDLVAEIRAVAHAVPDADAVVGGVTAADLDARAANDRDLRLIAPLVLVVCLLVLFVLLRSVLAPLLLLTVNLFSALAAIGAGAWLSRHLLDQSALDLQVPLLSFLFLVALGIDYTIFLVHRARAGSTALGTRDAMVAAVSRTGGVITSAGIVLAAVFAALGVLPLVTLGQLGLIVGVGVVMDTLVVRTVVVPALFGVLGDTVWWPRRIRREDAESSHGQPADDRALTG